MHVHKDSHISAKIKNQDKLLWMPNPFVAHGLLTSHHTTCLCRLGFKLLRQSSKSSKTTNQTLSKHGRDSMRSCPRTSLSGRFDQTYLPLEINLLMASSRSFNNWPQRMWSLSKWDLCLWNKIKQKQKATLKHDWTSSGVKCWYSSVIIIQYSSPSPLANGSRLN